MTIRSHGSALISLLRGLGLSLMLATFVAACDDAGVGPDPVGEAFPEVLSELDVDAAEAHVFVPEWELWTNGAVKERRIRLTQGGRVDISEPGNWGFPDGTRLTKTFGYHTATSPGTPVPIETRVILKVSGEWRTAVYRWRADGFDADLLSGDGRVPVAVTLADGTSLEHVIPSRNDCQSCHASQPSFVLGFSELQLSSIPPEESVSQLQRFEDRGYFAQPIPSEPDRITASDATTREVLGYVEGNCVHCHNAASPVVGLDLSHRVFLQNTVRRPATNGLPLITPGDAEASFLYQQFASGRMPGLGVQRLDVDTRDLLAGWIHQHDFDE